MRPAAPTLLWPRTWKESSGFSSAPGRIDRDSPGRIEREPGDSGRNTQRFEPVSIFEARHAGDLEAIHSNELVAALEIVQKRRHTLHIGFCPKFYTQRPNSFR